MKFLYFLLALVSFQFVSIAFSGKGSGTKDDPFQITDIYQLQEINYHNKADYILMNDIDGSETRNWNVGDHDKDSTTPGEPMGFEPMFFGGSLNGNGYKIKNLYINRPKGVNIALIRISGGNIKKLGIEDCQIIGCDNVSSLCGNVAAGIIEQCYTTGLVVVKCPSGPNAGFCGYLSGGFINNSYSSCIVIGDTVRTDYSAASFCEGYDAMSGIEYCYTNGKVFSNKKVSAFGQFEYAYYCFWDVDSTGIPDSGGHVAKGLHTPEMKKRATYEAAGWDFDSVWCIDEGRDYPRLRVFGKCKPISVHEEPSQNENKLSISPNPASSPVNISYTVSSYSFVRLSVFDIFGNEAGEIVNEYQTAGSREACFDAGSLAEGVYFVVLRSQGLVLSRQLAVVK